MKYITAEQVIQIHDTIIGDNELQGLAANKSIEAIVSRIYNRMNYGLIEDVFQLASCYACYIAVGHAFNDANKRTAFATMNLCLSINGIDISYQPDEIGDLIVQASQRAINEDDLSKWLRNKLINQL